MDERSARETDLRSAGARPAASGTDGAQFSRNRTVRFDVVFVVTISAAVGLGLITYWLHGSGRVAEILSHEALFILRIAPLTLAGILLGALARRLLPVGLIGRWLGRGSGLRGLGLATTVGALTPGGPFASLPVVVALQRAGADAGALVAFVTAWSMLGVYRVLVWEVPVLGLDFAVPRFFVSLPLPILAGLLARSLVHWLPLEPGKR